MGLIASFSQRGVGYTTGTQDPHVPGNLTPCFISTGPVGWGPNYSWCWHRQTDRDRQTDRERHRQRVSETESQTETDRDSPLFIRFEMEVADTSLHDYCRLPGLSERSALRLLYVMIAFTGCPVHWRDLSLSSGSAIPAWGAATSRSTDVWEWRQAANMASVPGEVWRQHHRRVLRRHRGQLQYQYVVGCVRVVRCGLLQCCMLWVVSVLYVVGCVRVLCCGLCQCCSVVSML